MGPREIALNVEVHADASAVAERAAAWIAAVGADSIAQRGRFVLALSGGTTPAPTLRRLAAQSIDWRRVEIVQVDERVAPERSRERNLAMLRDTLLSRVALAPERIHPMPVTDRDLAAAASAYARLLARVAGSPPVIDLVQLGLGEDGHTASLVPGDAALKVDRADVAVTAPYRGLRRMTLTFPILNRARRVLWLVTGDGKADALLRLARGDPALPASRVGTESALVLADRAAAARMATRSG